MPKSQYVDPGKVFERGFAEFTPIPLCQYNKTLKEEKAIYTKEDFLRIYRDMRIIRAVLVPAACFLIATVLRPLIDKQRPYDRFDTPPVGSYRPGKGKSMPSRHTASAAAIACAVVYVFPRPAVVVCMALLCALIGGLRVLSGQHDLSDVLAALTLSLALSLAGYLL